MTTDARLASTMVLFALLSGRPVAAAGAEAGAITACETEIGQDAALRLQKACQGVSPATRPPCGAKNSCALIQDEIARSCAIIGDAEAAKTPACGPAPTSAEAAVAVVRRYYRAIDEHDYSTAYALMRSDAGKMRSFAAFRDGFAKTKSTHVEPGKPGTVEGAAGSAYVTVPVTVEAMRDDGEHQRFTGSYVLRRTNVAGLVPSDDARWHIFSAELRAEGKP